MCVCFVTQSIFFQFPNFRLFLTPIMNSVYPLLIFVFHGDDIIHHDILSEYDS